MAFAWISCRRRSKDAAVGLVLGNGVKTSCGKVDVLSVFMVLCLFIKIAEDRREDKE
jgi:hypothetical protein